VVWSDPYRFEIAKHYQVDQDLDSYPYDSDVI
jgi:hypothetical protein